MNNIDRLITKYSQSDITKLKDSVTRVFQAVIASSKKLKQTISAPETNKILDEIINKLSNYLNQNSLSLSEYYTFVKNLVNNTGWTGIEPNDKVKLITKPLEMAYQWLNKSV